ncbi:MAG TPA: hypothetical protein VEB60_03050 [Candidatus Paceibacterota bacterium]|nr:hypothetical protein [Candidatus Paceibacterota bacterium]
MFPDFSFDIFLALRFLLYLLPFILGFVIWHAYLTYIRTKFIHNMEWVTLEIRVPREINKSPYAMEVVLGAFHQTGDGNMIDRYIKGKVRPWFALEIASFGGDVHFFVQTPKDYKNLIESHFYSQYPEIEVVEAEDYTKNVPYGAPSSDWDIWGCEFELTKPEIYPIKTYIDYGLADNPKEEYKVDPITPTIEYMGSLQPGMQSWLQIIIMGHKARYNKPGTWFGKQEWRDEYKDEYKKILKRDKPPEKESRAESNLSPGEQEVARSVERNLNKFPFDCGIRGLYLAPKEIFNKGYTGSLMGCVKHYGSPLLNGFKPTEKTGFDYAWQDLWGKKLAKKKSEMFGAYRRRGYFYAPINKKPMTLTTEEIATMWHLPGTVASTPTLGRIESKRGEPPANLPL